MKDTPEPIAETKESDSSAKAWLGSLWDSYMPESIPGKIALASIATAAGIPTFGAGTALVLGAWTGYKGVKDNPDESTIGRGFRKLGGAVVGAAKGGLLVVGVYASTIVPAIAPVFAGVVTGVSGWFGYKSYVRYQEAQDEQHKPSGQELTGVLGPTQEQGRALSKELEVKASVAQGADRHTPTVQEAANPRPTPTPAAKLANIQQPSNPAEPNQAKK